MTWKALANFIPELLFQLDNPFNGPTQIFRFVVDYFGGNY